MKNQCDGNHDHTDKGECLVVEWVGTDAGKERYERSETKAHTEQDLQEEIDLINKQNKIKIANNILKENNWQF